MLERSVSRTALAAAAIGIVIGCAGERSPKAPQSNSRAERTELGFDAVAFLIGDWEGTTVDGRFDEHWVAPRGGIMLGIGREVSLSGVASFFELLRIERRGGELVLVPQPGGHPGHDFKLVRALAGAVVFENAGDDRVGRISYALHGDELVANVEYREGGRSDEFRLRRISCVR